MDDGFNAFLGVEFAENIGSEPLGFVSDYGLPYATKANQTISSYASTLYWDGDIDSHSWAAHGWSGKNAGKDSFDQSEKLEPYPTTAKHGPRVTWSRLGNMAIRASHYVGKMGDDGSFLGFVPMNTRTALPESAYAGQMMATVVQYFWHENPYSGLGKHPYKYYKNKSLPSTALWFLDKEVAENGRGEYPPVERYNIADDVKGYPKIGKFKNRIGPWNDRIARSDKSLVRFIDETSALGKTKKGPDKFEYAFRPQWIVPSSSGLSPLPPQNSTNDVGKAVWIYRFPKQLDETLDADQIEYWKAMHGIDYSMANTKEAYGFPSYKDKKKKWSFGKSVETMENYSILGRLEDDDD